MRLREAGAAFDSRLRAFAAFADTGRRRNALFLALAFALLVAGAAARVGLGGGAVVGSNLLDLLPGVHGDPLLAAALARNANVFLQNLVIAVTGEDAERTAGAAGAARARLRGAGYRMESPDAAGNALLALYREHRFELLTADDARALAAHPFDYFTARLEAGVASPGNPAGTPADPGGFLARYLAALPRPFPDLVPENGLLAATQSPHPAYLLPITLQSKAFGESGEARADAAVRLARAAVAAHCRDCRVYASGPALYSAAERAEARREITWIGAASTALIVLLVIGFFCSLRPLALTVACVGGGIVAGGAATLLIFGEINLLTAVFGTTLLGIAVDYAFHYLTDYRLERNPGSLVRTAPGLTLGLVTSIVAFAFLAATPFPALRQIAAFSIAGLLGAYATVFALFPLAAGRRRGAAPAAMVRLAGAVARGPGWMRLVATLALLVAAAGGLARLHAADDLRELQAPPSALTAETAEVNALLGTPPERGFYFVRAPTLSAALARERTLETAAARKLPDAVLIGPAGFLPSPGTQSQAHAAWSQLLVDRGSTLRRAVATTGLPENLVALLVKQWGHGTQPLTPAELLRTAPALRNLVVRSGGETGLVVQVNGKATGERLAALATGIPGTDYVDPLARLNATFAHIRWHATLWVGVGYFLILLLLALRYGVRGGIAAMIPPVAAAAVTLGLLGWLNQPVNVFVVVALMLVAGIGVDYAVFLREGAGHLPATALAVVLAAFTTLASFGLLAASRVPALHAFGLTVAIGIAVSWIAAPLALAGTRRRP